MGPTKSRVKALFNREFAKVENGVDWDVFADGSRIAVLIINKGTSRIRIVRSSGVTEREFTVARSGISNVNCSSDGKGLYLEDTPQPGVSALLYSDLHGQLRVVWEQKGNFHCYVRASPDGRYLALTGTTTTKDAWLLENF